MDTEGTRTSLIPGQTISKVSDGGTSWRPESRGRPGPTSKSILCDNASALSHQCELESRTSPCLPRLSVCSTEELPLPDGAPGAPLPRRPRHKGLPARWLRFQLQPLLRLLSPPLHPHGALKLSQNLLPSRELCPMAVPGVICLFLGEGMHLPAS